MACLKIQLPAYFEGKERLGDHPGQRLCSSRGRSGGVKAAGVPTVLVSVFTLQPDEKHTEEKGRFFF